MGDDRYSGTVMWPGGNFPYQGKNITWTMPFENGYDWRKRVDQVGDTAHIDIFVLILTLYYRQFPG